MKPRRHIKTYNIYPPLPSIFPVYYTIHLVPDCPGYCSVPVVVGIGGTPPGRAASAPPGSRQVGLLLLAGRVAGVVAVVAVGVAVVAGVVAVVVAVGPGRSYPVLTLL